MSSGLLLTGAEGQLGSTFRQHWAESTLAKRFQLSCIDQEELDLTEKQAVHAYLDHHQPGVIVNAAAYTAPAAWEVADLA